MVLPLISPRRIVSPITLALGLGLMSMAIAPSASASPTAVPTGSRLGETVQLAGRLRLRLGSRPVRYRLGAFRRGASCLEGEAELLPLIPAVTETEAEEGAIPVDLTVPVDATTLSHPAFFIYVPPLDAATTAQFTLQTDPDNLAAVEELVGVRFPIAAEGGIVGIHLPDTIAGLEVDEQYYWQMAVECDTEELTANPVVSGWLRRIADEDLPPAPTTATAAVLFYAEQGIWQNALTLLANARYAQPEDRNLTQTWQDLLTAAGLAEIADAPLMQRVELTVREETDTAEVGSTDSQP